MAKTGNVIVTERDTNPFSPSYDTTRTIIYQDLIRCDPSEETRNYKWFKLSTGGFEYTFPCDSYTELVNGSDTHYDDGSTRDRRTALIIKVGDCVTTIDTNSLSNCSALEELYFSESVTTFNTNSVQNNPLLTTLILPSGTLSIGRYAFSNCSGLTSIYVKATTPPTLGENAFYHTNNCPIYVPSTSVNDYKAASGWSTYASRIQAIPS